MKKDGMKDIIKNRNILKLINVEVRLNASSTLHFTLRLTLVNEIS